MNWRMSLIELASGPSLRKLGPPLKNGPLKDYQADSTAPTRKVQYQINDSLFLRIVTSEATV